MASKDEGGDRRNDPAGNRLRGLRILVAEDSYLIAGQMRAILEHHGAKVIGPFASMSAAQESLTRLTPDVAVVDMNLRDAMADDLIEMLSGLAVPVVVVTGYEHLPSNTYDLISNRLNKPIHEQTLVEAIAGATTAR